MPKLDAPRYMYSQVEEGEVTWSNECRNPSDVELVGFELTMRVQG